LLVAVTNAPDSPLSAAAGTSVVMDAGKEHSVSSKTYLASLAALAWLGDHLTGANLGGSREELSLLAPAIDAYLAQWREYVARARSELEGIERVYYVGRGPSLAAVGTAGLTTKESARFPAEGMSAAAFRHGPLEMVDQRVLLVVFEGDPRTAGLNHGLARDVKLAGGRAVVVREAVEAGLFHTPPVPPRLRAVMEMLPVQMITLALAAMVGQEAGAFALASKVTLTE
jgi:glucosamine--fructose-6-phosphate aminotransferase (isomerizing)